MLILIQTVNGNQLVCISNYIHGLMTSNHINTITSTTISFFDVELMDEGFTHFPQASLARSSSTMSNSKMATVNEELF